MHAELRLAYQRARNASADISTGIKAQPKQQAHVIYFVPNAPYGKPKILPKPEPVKLNLENLGFRRRAFDVEYERAWYKEICGEAPLGRMLVMRGDRIRLRQIRDAVCENFQLNPNVFASARRHQVLLDARGIAMYLAKYNTLCSLPELGRWLGDRDHTTILSGLRRIEKRFVSEPDLRARADMLGRRLGFTEQPEAINANG